MNKGSTNEPGAAVISPRMAKAMASPLRSRIMMELSNGPQSPSQLAETIDDDLSEVARACRQLAEWGFAEMVGERKRNHRRGGKEKVYRQLERAYFDTASWAGLPGFLRNDFSVNILETLWRRISDALKTGTFDSEIDRHLSWDGLALDRLAWTQLTDELDKILDWVPDLEAESARRIASSGEEVIPTTVALMAFRSPKPSEVLKRSHGIDAPGRANGPDTRRWVRPDPSIDSDGDDADRHAAGAQDVEDDEDLLQQVLGILVRAERLAAEAARDGRALLSGRSRFPGGR